MTPHPMSDDDPPRRAEFPAAVRGFGNEVLNGMVQRGEAVRPFGTVEVTVIFQTGNKKAPSGDAKRLNCLVAEGLSNCCQKATYQKASKPSQHFHTPKNTPRTSM